MNRKRLYEILQIGNEGDSASRAFDIFIAITIIINISILFCQTFSSLDAYDELFNVLEFITIGIFIVEYILRIFVANCEFPEVSPEKARIKFALSFDGIVDLLTILPGILPFITTNGTAVFQLFRIVRIMHLFRIGTRYDALNVIGHVLRSKKNQLFSSVFIIMVLIASASLLMYSVEHEAQPEAFDNAFSGIWWAASTVFTVGYGDIYPITLAGRIIGVLITFLGVGVVAVPTGIISAGFVELYSEAQRKSRSEEQLIRTVNLIVDARSPYRNVSVSEIYRDYGILIAIIVRKGQILTPTADMRIEEGDTIFYQMSFGEDY